MPVLIQYNASVYFSFNDYGLKLMKSQHSVSQKIRILLKTKNKKNKMTTGLVPRPDRN